MSLIICSPFFWEDLGSVAGIFWISHSVSCFGVLVSSGSLAGFLSSGAGGRLGWVVGGPRVLASSGGLAAVGPKTPVPGPVWAFCCWGCMPLGPCWLMPFCWAGCWLAGAWWRGDPIGWCFGDGWGRGRGASPRLPDIRRWVWQFKHSHSFFCKTQTNGHTPIQPQVKWLSLLTTWRLDANNNTTNPCFLREVRECGETQRWWVSYVQRAPVLARLCISDGARRNQNRDNTFWPTPQRYTSHSEPA